MLKKIGFAVLSAALALCAYTSPARAQFGQRLVPLGFCALSSVASATKITTANCVFGTFTGVISGTTLTVSSLTGSLVPGQNLVGAGIASNTVVSAQLTGSAGLAGTYSVNNSQTIGSESMTTAGVPPSSNYVLLCATTQNVNYRDDPTAPTATPGTGGQPIPTTAPCVGYSGTISNLQFIQQGATAILGVSFYR